MAEGPRSGGLLLGPRMAVAENPPHDRVVGQCLPRDVLAVQSLLVHHVAMLAQLLGPLQAAVDCPPREDLLRPVGAKTAEVDLLADRQLETHASLPFMEGAQKVAALVDDRANAVLPHGKQAL